MHCDCHINDQNNKINAIRYKFIQGLILYGANVAQTCTFFAHKYENYHKYIITGWKCEEHHTHSQQHWSPLSLWGMFMSNWLLNLS